jgi:ankyrin repeat protein
MLLGSAALGRVDLVEQALNRGANIEAHDDSEEQLTALLLAARSGHEQALKQLLVRGADVNARTRSGITALMFAAHDDRLALAKVLVTHGADINARDDHFGNSPLHVAAQFGSIQTLGYLLAHGGDPNVASRRDGRTPLILAAREARGLKAIVELIAAGADVNKTAKDGYTALMGASMRGHSDISATLLANKADPNAASSDGRSALHRAAMRGRVEIVQQLLKAGAQIEIRAGDGDTPLGSAVYFGQAYAVAQLIKAGADPDGPARSGETPLMLAVRGNHPGILEALLSYGANANAEVDEDGRTALLLAAERGLEDAVHLLVTAGAKVNHRARDGRTALSAAEAIGDSETAAILRGEAGIPAQNPKGDKI